MIGTRGKGSSSGFSLTELAITLGISAILTAIAIPNFSNTWIPKHRLRIAVRKMATHAQEAKGAAAKTGRQSVMHFDSTGYEVFIDQPPYDSVFDADGLDDEAGTSDDENLIRRVDLPKGIGYNTALGGGGRHHLRLEEEPDPHLQHPGPVGEEPKRPLRGWARLSDKPEREMRVHDGDENRPYSDERAVKDCHDWKV